MDLVCSLVLVIFSLFMFDDQQSQPGAVSSSKKASPPEDIFSGVDTSASAPANPAPRAPSATPAPVPPGLGDHEIFSAPPVPRPTESFGQAVAPREPVQAVSMVSHGRTAKKMILIGVIAVLVVIAAVLLASLILRSQKAMVPAELSPVPSVTTPIEEIISPSSSVIPGSDNPRVRDDLLLGGSGEPESPAVPTDSDRDGLSDEEELSLGTSSRSADTDADGLSDRDETKQWGTNPLNPDTDGDSYKDGDEVNNGYDPKGSGKLFEIPGE